MNISQILVIFIEFLPTKTVQKSVIEWLVTGMSRTWNAKISVFPYIFVAAILFAHVNPARQTDYTTAVRKSYNHIICWLVTKDTFAIVHMKQIKQYWALFTNMLACCADGFHFNLLISTFFTSTFRRICLDFIQLGTTVCTFKCHCC